MAEEETNPSSCGSLIPLSNTPPEEVDLTVNTKSRLLLLPRELRSIIYPLVIGSPPILTSSPDEFPIRPRLSSLSSRGNLLHELGGFESIIMQPVCKWLPSAAQQMRKLTHVCRQVNNETREELAQFQPFFGSVFTLDIMIDQDCMYPTWTRPFNIRTPGSRRSHRIPLMEVSLRLFPDHDSLGPYRLSSIECNNALSRSLLALFNVIIRNGPNCGQPTRRLWCIDVLDIDVISNIKGINSEFLRKWVGPYVDATEAEEASAELLADSLAASIPKLVNEGIEKNEFWTKHVLTGVGVMKYRARGLLRHEVSFT
ncbi:MAG: hypothetical protein M1820_008392 [Bogoriella megaspora]|nr:MAG: hypothetical protein M1820_008392 [Bogoriella megaspora]